MTTRMIANRCWRLGLLKVARLAVATVFPLLAILLFSGPTYAADPGHGDRSLAPTGRSTHTIIGAPGAIALATALDIGGANLISASIGTSDADCTGTSDEAVSGVFRMSLNSFTHSGAGTAAFSVGNQATSVVTAFGRLRVTHDYHPSGATSDLYEVDVTIKNISAIPVTDLRYTRVMDWDIPSTAFREAVTIQGVATAANLLYATTTASSSPIPLLARFPRVGGAGDQIDTGPADHGALFDFGFGALGAGESFSFRIYYGASNNETNALAALAAVSAEAYSFGQPASDFITGTPNTFIFAFSGIGGPPVADDPPLALDDLATVTEDDLGSAIDVLGNDANADGGPISIVSVTQPANGTVVVTGGGNSREFSMTVLVKEIFPDLAADTARPGNIGQAMVTMTLWSVAPGDLVSVLCAQNSVTGTGYDAELSVTCTFVDVPVNTYRAETAVEGATATTRFYSGLGEEVLVVYDTSLGFSTGGRWFYWPETNDQTNFGYTIKYHENGNKVKGSLLLIRHSTPGTFGSNYRIKSTAIFGLSLGTGENTGEFGWASFSGESTYQEPDVEGAAGNDQFVAYVEDHGVPGGGKDRFWIEIRDSNGDLVMDLSMSTLAASNAELVEEGNIVVPHETQTRKPVP